MLYFIAVHRTGSHVAVQDRMSLYRIACRTGEHHKLLNSDMNEVYICQLNDKLNKVQ